MLKILSTPVNKNVLARKNNIEKSAVVRMRRLEIILNNYNKRQSKKYRELWEIAKRAMYSKKIFTVHSSHNFSYIRHILKSKGWIEKIDYRQLNYLLKELNTNNNDSILEVLILSKIVRDTLANFVWFEGEYSSVKLEPHQMRNKIKLKGNCFTTKSGLCESIKDNRWNCIPNVSNVNAPRSYNAYYPDEIEEFKFDYKLTACTSLLKWFITTYDVGDEVLLKRKGGVPFSTIHFALEGCKVYMAIKKHEDVDMVKIKKPILSWNKFFLNCHKLIRNIDYLTFDINDAIDVYVMYAQDILERVGKYNPQLNWEGIFNIWIIKPANLCRGRGILLESDLNNILRISTQNNNLRYVIQKYIERPLLIYETKFDIRQYYLISCTEPLTIWMYKNCYLRFVSRKYSLEDFHESIHLTNNAVQCKYEMCNNENNDIPSYKMWDLFKFRSYLDSIGNGDVWNEIIYPQMKQNVVCVMLCSKSGLTKGTNCFELYGCDFVLDENFKPWLIEINACPDLSASTPVTSVICKAALEDLVKVVVDYRSDFKASTGNFECIYREMQTQHFCQFEMPGLKVEGKRIPKKTLHLI